MSNLASANRWRTQNWPGCRFANKRRINPLAAAAGGRNSLWLWAITTLLVSYVVASQTLCNSPGWSNLTFGLAGVLVFSLLAGRILGTLEFRAVGWLFIPLTFLGY